MDIEQALNFASKGESILFIGAGFSLGATNVKGYSFKSGTDLNNFFCTQLHLPPNTPLGDTTEIYVDTYGSDDLIRVLRNEYTVREVTDQQVDIARLPWLRVYTTNYDNVFEQAATQAGRVVTPISPEKNISSIPKNNPLCIHLNGYINDLDRDTIGNSFKLLDSSYATASIANSDWATLFRDDLKYARSIFFIGYSLYDLDIKRIIRSNPDLKKKTFFILFDGVDRVTEHRATKYGNVSRIGVAGLADLINSLDLSKTITKPGLNIGRSISEVHPARKKRPPTDEEFINLLMIGEFDPKLAMSEDDSNNNYICIREALPDIADSLDKGEFETAVIHSQIANGKSISTHVLSDILLQKGWRVFKATELSKYAEDELRSIARLEDRCVLVIDDYVNWFDHLQDLPNLFGDRFRLILTARNNSHDFFDDKLFEILSPWEIQEFSLDKLTPNEINWWAQTLENYGLWGSLAGQSLDSKKRFIYDRCHRQIHGILLKLLESPNIRKRLSDAAEEIKSDPIAENVCISIFIVSALNSKPSLDLITDYWGPDAFNLNSLQRNQGFQNFVDLNRSTIRIRSSAASEFLLKNFWASDKIVEILLKIAKKSSELQRISYQHELIFKSLIRFGNIQAFLPKKGKREFIIKYYERLKLIDRNNKFPLFWLQYAIAALVIDDLDRSERYFETAYSLADRRNWDTFQIDNHYARFLLIKATEKASYKEAFSYFRKARTLINRQIQTDKKYYPFRVASSYQSFFDKFESKFTEEDRNEIFSAANSVLERINNLPRARAINKYVKSCKESMLYIIQKVG